MPENYIKKKITKRKNEPPEQGVSINVKGQESEQAAINQAKPNEKETQGKEEGRSGVGLLKGIVNFIKGIANAIFDMPQQEQSGDRDKKYKEDPIQPESVLQGDWLRQSSQEIEQVTEKRPEDLPPRKVKEAAEGLFKEDVRIDSDSNRPIEGMAPDQTPPQDIESSETIKR